MRFNIYPLSGEGLQYGDYVLEILTSEDRGPQLKAHILLRDEDVDTLNSHLGTTRPLPEDLMSRTGLKTVHNTKDGGFTVLNTRAGSTSLTLTIPRAVTARLRQALRAIATTRKDS